MRQGKHSGKSRGLNFLSLSKFWTYLVVWSRSRRRITWANFVESGFRNYETTHLARIQESILSNHFCHNWTVIKLWQDFDAFCEMLSEFSNRHICACYLGLGHFHLDGANFKIQTHLVCKIMHQKWPHFYGSCITAKLVYIVGPWYWLVSIFYKLKGDSNNESKLWHHQLN